LGRERRRIPWPFRRCNGTEEKKTSFTKTGGVWPCRGGKKGLFDLKGGDPVQRRKKKKKPGLRKSRISSAEKKKRHSTGYIPFYKKTPEKGEVKRGEKKKKRKKSLIPNHRRNF